MTLLKRTSLILAIFLAGLSVTACNTIHGAGEDIESVGDKIADETEGAAAE